jgi:hypothetical protein
VQALVEDRPAPGGTGRPPREEDEGADPTSAAPAGGALAEATARDATLHRPGMPAWVFLAYGVAILWKVFYSPVALVAGAVSREFFATLNPLAGIGAIIRMGGTYWSAMGLYTVIAVLEALLVGALSYIPMAGKFLGAFVQSYTYLAIGCLLGLAVFKKAPELGLD